jgi:hypothetical protein
MRSILRRIFGGEPGREEADLAPRPCVQCGRTFFTGVRVTSPLCVDCAMAEHRIWRQAKEHHTDPSAERATPGAE